MDDKETQEEARKHSESEGKEGKEETPKELSKLQQYNAATDRRQEVNAETERLILAKTELIAEEKLGGITGGHIETKEVSEEDKKANQATEFFKGTALGDAIKKVNKKDE